MDVFPRAFLLVFCQLAVGGLFCLSIAPFHAIERGYFKSSAFVYVLIAVLALAGRLGLWWHANSSAVADVVEIGLWSIFVACSSAYLASLWSERVALRARLFAASVLSGLAALIALAERYRVAPVLSLETLFFPLSFLLSALALGAGASGMLLGHWYLIDRDLSLTPLEHTELLYRRSLLAQAILIATLLVVLSVAGAPPARAAVYDVLTEQRTLLAVRLAVSPMVAGGLGWMIRRTLDIPQTMAATGLFYIAVLAVVVGEMLGRFILFRTGLPL
jgi:hypothetical protein